MKRYCKSTKGFKPFQNLKKLLENYNLPDNHKNTKIPINSNKENRYSDEDELALFMNEVRDVTPLFNNTFESTRPKSQDVKNHKTSKDEITTLSELIHYGKGFVVSNTPEYMEGVGHNVNPLILKRLHRGDFSIQSHIDLHNLCVIDAKNSIDLFLQDSLISGKRAVLIIHGRGLSSTGEPLLKNKICEWLSKGYWRKWVIAFTSARLCDGGAGATYVLLRQKTATKQYRKRRK